MKYHVSRAIWSAHYYWICTFIEFEIILVRLDSSFNALSLVRNCCNSAFHWFVLSVIWLAESTTSFWNGKRRESHYRHLSNKLNSATCGQSVIILTVMSKLWNDYSVRILTKICKYSQIFPFSNKNDDFMVSNTYINAS